MALQDFAPGHDEPRLEVKRHIIEGTVGDAQNASGPEYLYVQIDRNASLAKFCAEATNADRGLLLPNDTARVMTDVHAHLKKLQRQRVVKSSGNKIDQFIDKVANHFGMAAASARLARLVAPEIKPFSWTPIPTHNEPTRMTPFGGWGALLGSR